MTDWPATRLALSSKESLNSKRVNTFQDNLIPNLKNNLYKTSNPFISLVLVIIFTKELAFVWNANFAQNHCNKAVSRSFSSIGQFFLCACADLYTLSPTHRILVYISHLHFVYNPNNNKFLCFPTKCKPEIESPPSQFSGSAQWSLPVIFVGHDQFF